LAQAEFEGKVVLVTGAASGICRAVFYAFVEAGAKGVLVDVDEEWGARIVEDVRARGQQAWFFRADVTDSRQVARVFEQTVAAAGGVDIVVHGADIRVRHEVVDTPEEEWDAKVGVVLKGGFLLCKEGARQMIRQGRGGRLILFGSTGGVVPRIGSAAHTVSKAGLVMLARVLAMELGRHGITVNVVGPGLTRIEGPARKSPLSDEYTQNFLREVPLGRLAWYEEMVHATLYFASERARYTTGQVIYVDGGYSAGKMGVIGAISEWRPPA
jgi:3-oxoacyl-[acyl-carrier protein] reductase